MKYLLKKIVKPLYFFINNRHEREFYRLLDKWNHAERFKKEENVKFLNFFFDLPDPQSFIWQFKEIFVDNIYEIKNRINTIVERIFDINRTAPATGRLAIYINRLSDV